MILEGKAIEIVRNLAKSGHYQTMYNNAKELNLQLFENIRNFSYLQIIFLNYLNFYSVIHTDIYLGDVPEEVLKDFLYEDAYLYFKKKKSRDNKEKVTKRKGVPYDSFKDSRKVNDRTFIFKSRPKRR